MAPALAMSTNDHNGHERSFFAVIRNEALPNNMLVTDQRFDGFTFFYQFFDTDRDAFAGKGRKIKILYAFITTIIANGWHTKKQPLRNVVTAIGTQPHGYPSSAAAQGPIAHMIDGSIGGGRRRRSATRLDHRRTRLATVGINSF